MGNCNTCLKEGPENNKKGHKGKGKSLKPEDSRSSIMSSSNDEENQRYTKITIDKVFQDTGDELGYLGFMDPDQILTFSQDEMYIQSEINEDFLKKKSDNKTSYKRKKNLENVQANDRSGNKNSNLSLRSQSEINPTRWKSQTFKINADGGANEIYVAQRSKRPIAYVAIDFLALALGPKQCDMEVKDYKTKRSIGRVALDIHVKQLQSTEVTMTDLKCKMTYKEEKPLFGLFKVISNNEAPKVSPPTSTQIGIFKKDKNLTSFHWKCETSEENQKQEEQNPSIVYEVSLETLKNSTLQIIIKQDKQFAQAVHDQVLRKIKTLTRFKSTHAKRDLKTVKEFSDPEGFKILEKSLKLNKTDQLEDYLQKSFQEMETDCRVRNHRTARIVSNRISKDSSSKNSESSKNSSNLNNSNSGKRKSQRMQLRHQQIIEKQGEQFDQFFKNPLTLSRNKSKTIAPERSSTVEVGDAADYYKKYNDQENNSHSISQSIIGECYLGFSKLLQSEYRHHEKRESNILHYKMNNSFKQKVGPTVRNGSIKNGSIRLQGDQSLSMNEASIRVLKALRGEKKGFTEQIWFMGKVIGTLSGDFQLKNMPIMQQMMLGILTENGIVMNAAPILLEERDTVFMGLLKKSHKNEKITQLIELTKRLKKIDNFKNKKHVYKTYNEKERILNDIILILSESDKTVQGQMFKYSDDFDIIRAQSAMIELAFHCLMLADNVRYEFRRDYYEILSQIFMRDELKLTNLAIAPEHNRKRSESMAKIRLTAGKREDIVSADKADEIQTVERIIHEKIKLAQFYQRLLYQTLDDCLNKFCRKDVEPYLRSYLEICMSIAFFRVPNFQKLFIDSISDNIKQPISEWKGVNWELDDENSMNIQQGLIKLFNWQINFFDHIPDNQDSEEAQRLLVKIESNKRWQSRIQKRSIAFFQIVKRWAELLQQTVQTYSLYWQDIPGYKIIIKSVLIEMKNRNVMEYPDSLIETTLALIQNTQLLTVLMTIVFQKTNAYDSNSLCATMNIILQWINYIEKLGLAFPSNFDFTFFLKGMNIALSVEHSISTPRALYVYYRTLHYFPIDQRNQLVQELFRKYFYPMFFSWSYNIRDVFIALLLYQIEYSYINKTTALLKQSNAIQGGNQQVEPLVQNMMRRSGSVRDLLKAQRKQALRQLEASLLIYEQQILQNPNEAEENFDKSLSTKQRVRLISSDTGLGRSRGNEGFIKSHQFFRKKMKEIEIIDDYLQSKKESGGARTSNQKINKSVSPSLSSMLTTDQTSQYDIEAQYQKILMSIPQNHRIYIPLAIEDFNRQVDEYEQWKTTTALYSNDMQSILPEFNMDKNNHIEDDENPYQSRATDEDLTVFSAERWVKQTKVLSDAPDQLDVDTWIAFLYETTNLFKKMGSAMSMAFSDITSKAEVIRTNKEQYLADSGKSATDSVSLQELIEYDLKRSVHELNGENNSSLLKKEKLDSHDYRHKYTSTARTVLRNMWLLDFLHHFMGPIYDNREAKLSAIAKEAYNQGLGPHHPWIVRQGAKVAMLAVPSRQTFLDETKAEYEQINEFRVNLEGFRLSLWKYYQDKAIDKLP